MAKPAYEKIGDAYEEMVMERDFDGLGAASLLSIGGLAVSVLGLGVALSVTERAGLLDWINSSTERRVAAWVAALALALAMGWGAAKLGDGTASTALALGGLSLFLSVGIIPPILGVSTLTDDTAGMDGGDGTAASLTAQGTVADEVARGGAEAVASVSEQVMPAGVGGGRTRSRAPALGGGRGYNY